MPKPILKDNNLVALIEENINLIKELDRSISINLNTNMEDIILNSDNEQLSRVFLILLKTLLKVFKKKD